MQGVVSHENTLGLGIRVDDWIDAYADCRAFGVSILLTLLVDNVAIHGVLLIDDLYRVLLAQGLELSFAYQFVGKGCRGQQRKDNDGAKELAAPMLEMTCDASRDESSNGQPTERDGYENKARHRSAPD